MSKSIQYVINAVDPTQQIVVLTPSETAQVVTQEETPAAASSKTAVKRKQIECPGCAKSYSSVVSLNDHIRKVHQDVQDELQNIVKAGQWRCTQFQCVMSAAGCMEVCKNRNELLRHLEAQHEIVVDWVDTIFTSVAQFEQYRVSLRAKGHFFIKATSRRKGRTAAEDPFTLFRCNREGQRLDRNRQRDVKNSIKIGTFCTAYLKCFFRKDDTIRCAGSLTHCNHAINYRVREIDGGISGRLQVINDDEANGEIEDNTQMQCIVTDELVEQIEEDHMSQEIPEQQVIHEVTEIGESHMDQGEIHEVHIVHEHVEEDEEEEEEEGVVEGVEADTQDKQHFELTEFVTDVIEDPAVMAATAAHGGGEEEENEGQALYVVTQDDSTAHQNLNSLVETTIWKLQQVQEQHTGQRLIFYADALQHIVRSSHESISRTIMEHLQKQKTRKITTSQA